MRGTVTATAIARSSVACAVTLFALLLILLVGQPGTALAQSQSSDATLSALTVSPGGIIGFAADRTSYQVGVASTVTQATINGTANHSAASVAYSPTDADTGTAVHDVDLSAGRNVVTVTAEDGTTTRAYTVSVNRGVTKDYGWKAVDDLDGLIAAGNGNPRGVWSNGTTIWVADGDDDKIYAYRMSDKTRDIGKDFDTLAAAGNNSPYGVWSNGTTMWVADEDDDKLYAYNMSDKTRDGGKDFDTSAEEGNSSPSGIWSDGTIMWVADSAAGKLYAYRIDGTRDSKRDFHGYIDDTDLPTLLPRTKNPRGIWSDSAAKMWVAGGDTQQVEARRMSSASWYDSV